jgi:FkbM family methyltransferase
MTNAGRWASRVRAFGNYVLIVASGCVLGIALLAVLAGTGLVIPQKLLVTMELRTELYWPLNWGRHFMRDLRPLFEKTGALKPVRMEIEPGVSLLLDPKDYLSRMILISGEWQPGVWQSVSSSLSNGAVFLDVGAHIGYDTIKAAVRVGETGRVVAFEPNPNTLAQLRANIAASRASIVIVEPIACTDREQMLTLYDSTSEGNSAASSLSLANADEHSEGALPSYRVRGRRIDDVVGELGLKRVDVVKIDVEGAEYSVLRGARETLTRFHPKIVLEMEPRELANMNTKVEDLRSLLREMGYNASKQVDEDDWEWTAQ